MQSKTFDEFWQFFLQVTFHEGNPERWSKRELKAKWFESCLNLSPGEWIVDLGCGDGILDIWLSRMGYKVTAIDRSQPVLTHAKTEDDTQAVNFEAKDLRHVNFPEQSLNGIIIHETLGLMNQEDDLDLLMRSFSWLKPGGRIVTDCPVKPSIKNNWSKEFPDGRIDAFTSFDEKTRIHQLNFEFSPKDGEPFNLYDPYCPKRHDGAGISRYIYTQPELVGMMQKAGFSVKSINHFYGESYFALIGQK
jgi:ubiquinone/menaquinone biosynthesis C-methylase UbiE